MHRIEGITAEPNQRHTIIYGEKQIELTLKFNPATESWLADIVDGERESLGNRLQIGWPLLYAERFDFDFLCTTTDGNDTRPLTLEDFGSGRSELYLVTEDEIRALYP